MTNSQSLICLHARAVAVIRCRTLFAVHAGTTRTARSSTAPSPRARLIAGYTLIQVRSRDEALEWTRRFPNPVGEGLSAEIEVRRLYEMEDFASVAR